MLRNATTSAAQQLVSLEGYRQDGRRRRELRDLKCLLGHLTTTHHCEGSAEVQCGCTRVVAYVSGPAEYPTLPSNASRAIIKCSFSSTPFSRPFRSVQRPGNKKSSARAGLLETLLSSLVRVEAYRKSTLSVSIVVLQDDGGVLATAINAAVLALVDAGVLLKDIVSASTVALLGDGQVILDPTDEEERAAAADLTLATLRSTGKFACVQAWAKVDEHLFTEVLKGGQEACDYTSALMVDSIVEAFAGMRNKARAAAQRRAAAAAEEMG